MVIDSPLLKIFYIYFPTWSESVVSMPLLWFGSFCFWMPRSDPLLAVPTQNELPILIHTWNDLKMNIHKSQMICILKDKSQEESQDSFAANSFLFPVTLAVLLCVTLRRVLWNVLFFRGHLPTGYWPWSITEQADFIWCWSFRPFLLLYPIC